MTNEGISWWILAGAAVTALLAWQIKVLVDVYAHPFLARIGWRRRRAPRRYVRALFDGYARDYDRHLLHDLEYAGANLVSSALNDHLARHPRSLDRALDLGCGTGVTGVLLVPRVRHLIGVDLAPAMLQKASATRAYDALYEADMLRFLRRQRNAFDLITAADVLVYVGDLRPLLRAAARSLKPGGALIFTTESDHNPGYRLLPTGRFAHHPDYIADLGRSCGLLLESQTAETLRLQSDRPVPGGVHVLTKPEPAET